MPGETADMATAPAAPGPVTDTGANLPPGCNCSAPSRCKGVAAKLLGGNRLSDDCKVSRSENYFAAFDGVDRRSNKNASHVATAGERNNFAGSW